MLSFMWPTPLVLEVGEEEEDEGRRKTLGMEAASSQQDHQPANSAGGTGCDSGGEAKIPPPEERVRSFYASWGPTLKGEDDIRRISAELVAGDSAVLDAFNSRLRARFHGTCLSSTPVSPWAENIIIQSVIGIPIL
jgi:hypothetical protein